MLKIIKQLKHKKIIISLIVIFVLVGLGLMLTPSSFVWAASTVSAGAGTTSTLGQWIAQFLTWIMTLFTSLIGKVLMLLINLLLWVSSYNQFIHTTAVDIGWSVVRDIANIFFVIIMLTIALGTLFNVQTYEYKKLLPKLMAAVILVNFSKMIVGLAIDVGQVIMLTFVHVYEKVGAGAIVNGLSLQSMFDLKELVEDKGGKGGINYWTLFGSASLALIMLIVASVVVLQLVVVLLFRIIMLWVLVIFSPIAFVASVLPTSPLQKVNFFGQYWNYLSKYIIIGPVLAFFLWLSFSIMQTVNQKNDEHIIDLQHSKDNVAFFATEISSPDNLFDYMTTIALLLASLMITQQMGVMGGSMGMNAVNKMKGMASKAAVGAASWSLVGRKDKAGVRRGGLLGAANWGDRHLWEAKGTSPYRTLKKWREGRKQRQTWKEGFQEMTGDIKAGDHLKAKGMRSIILGVGAGRDWADAYATGGFLNRKGFAHMGHMIKGGKFKEIEEDIKKEQKHHDELKREKEDKDITAKYVEKHKNNIEENEKEKAEKVKELESLNKFETTLKKANEELQKAIADYGEGSKEAEKAQARVDKLLEDSRYKTQEEIDARRGKLNKSLVNNHNAIAESQAILSLPKEQVRAKAIEEYKNKIEDLKKESTNLDAGLLSQDKRTQLSNENRELSAELKKIKKAIEEEKRPIIKAKLEKDAKQKQNRINEIGAILKKGVEEDDKTVENNKKKAEEMKDEVKYRERILKKYESGNMETDESLDKKIKESRDTIEKYKTEQRKYAAPQTFYADHARRAMEAEESKKILSDNWHEQAAAMDEALREGNWAKFVANFKAATQRGNDNEIMDHFGYLNSYHGPEEDKGPGTGGGVEAFRKHFLVDKLGMTQEASMATMDDIGYMAENIGHWSIARGYEVKGGRRRALTNEEHNNEVYAEQSKVGGRTLYRNYNRLAWGGEIPQADGSRLLKLDPYAIKRIVNDFRNISQQLKKDEFNPSTAEHWTTPIAWKQIVNIKKRLPPEQHAEFETFKKRLWEYGSGGRKENKKLKDDIADIIRSA